MLTKTLVLHPFVKQGDCSVAITRDIVTHVAQATLTPGPLATELARALAAPTALMALGIPLCPSCELLTSTLGEIGVRRPNLTIAIAALSTPDEWAARTELLWPRGIHVSRASVPVLVLFRAGEVLAVRQGGGPAAMIDAWLTRELGPTGEPPITAITPTETVRLNELTSLRARHLGARDRRSVASP